MFDERNNMYTFITFVVVLVLGSIGTTTCADANATVAVAQTTVAAKTMAATTIAATTVAATTNMATTTANSSSNLVTINGQLVRLIDNCILGINPSCPIGYCCTKEALVYAADYVGETPVYQMACKPLRLKGEFCYFKTPEKFCPCLVRCVSNGFFGNCA